MTNLEDTLTKLFYNYMSSTDIEEFNGEEVEDSKLTPVDLLYQETVNSLEDVKKRIKMYEEEIAKIEEGEIKQVLTSQLQPLLEEKKHFENSSFEYMKKIYEETGDTYYSRNYVRICLGNFEGCKYLKELFTGYKIYADFLFYDDLGVLNGKYEEYKKLRSQESRKQFIFFNTEITHIAIVLEQKYKGATTLMVKGEISPMCLNADREAFNLQRVEPCTKQ